MAQDSLPVKITKTTRRRFLKSTLAAMATITIAGTKSSGQVLGANDTIRVGVAGIHGQGKAHIEQYIGLKGCQITRLIDPDSRLQRKPSDHRSLHVQRQL